MMINVGMLAKTYGILPSQVIANATTYDLMIADVMSTWDDYQSKRASGKPYVPNLSVKELTDILNKARNNE